MAEKFWSCPDHGLLGVDGVKADEEGEGYWLCASPLILGGQCDQRVYRAGVLMMCAFNGEGHNVAAGHLVFADGLGDIAVCCSCHDELEGLRFDRNEHSNCEEVYVLEGV